MLNNKVHINVIDGYDFYRQSVDFYLKNDFNQLKQNMQSMDQNSEEYMLLQARLYIRDRDIEATNELLQKLEKSIEKSANYFQAEFWSLKASFAYCQYKKSSLLFQKAASFYALAGDLDSEFRVTINSCVDLFVDGKYQDVIAICDALLIRAEGCEKELRDKLMFRVLNKKFSCALLLREYGESLALLKKMRSNRQLDIIPRRDQSIIFLSEINIYLNFGDKDKAGELLEDFIDYLGEDIINQTYNYLYWRWQCQLHKSAIEPKNFIPAKCIDSVQEDANVLLSLFYKGYSDSKDSVDFPEFKLFVDSFYWSEKQAKLFAGLDVVVIKCHKDSQKFLLLNLLASKEIVHKQELLQTIYGSDLGDLRAEKYLYSLISQINGKVPTLIQVDRQNYSFNKKVALYD